MRAVALSGLCSLVRLTTGEPSRSCHGEGHAWWALFRVSSSGLSGVREAARAHGLVRNRRDPSAWPSSGKDQGYKPMVKAFGGQRESDGVVVPLIGVQHNAPGGKGPDFDHAGEVGKREGMTGRVSVQLPHGPSSVVADDAPLASPGKVRELQRTLWAAAEAVFRSAFPCPV